MPESRGSPQQQARRHQAIDGETVDQPTDRKLHWRINPEEGRGDDAESGGAKSQLRLHQRRGDAYGASVDIVEEDGCAEQRHQQRGTAPLRRPAQ